MADTLSRAFPPGASEGAAFPEEVATLSTVDEDQMAELARDSCRSRDMFTTVSHVRRRTQRELRTRVQRLPTVWSSHGRPEPPSWRDFTRRTPALIRLRRARETVYWPGITDDIKRAIVTCDICARHHQSI